MSPPRAAVPIDLETNRQVSMALDYRFLVADTGRVVSTNYTEGGAFLSLRALDPDGTTKAQDFRSVYKPWQQQCLIGKAGAPRISLGKDGSIKELPPLESATTTPQI